MRKADRDPMRSVVSADVSDPACVTANPAKTKPAIVRLFGWPRRLSSPISRISDWFRSAAAAGAAAVQALVAGSVADHDRAAVHAGRGVALGGEGDLYVPESERHAAASVPVAALPTP